MPAANAEIVYLEAEFVELILD